MSTDFIQMKALLGDVVKEVREFEDGGFNSGFLIFFTSGKVLTAQDGEYGDNAFEFLTLEEAREKKVIHNHIAGIV